MPPDILRTKRLVLRAFRETDLPSFVAYRSNPEVARYQGWETYSLEDARRFFEGQKGLTFNTPETWFQVAAVRQGDEQMVGDVAVHFTDEGRQAELGATMNPQHQRQGYAKEALDALVTLLFEQHKKHRLQALVDARNAPAQRLMASLGFRREAHFVEGAFYKGEWCDEYVYAMLASEWRERASLSGKIGASQT